MESDSDLMGKGAAGLRGWGSDSERSTRHKENNRKQKFLQLAFTGELEETWICLRGMGFSGMAL